MKVSSQVSEVLADHNKDLPTPAPRRPQQDQVDRNRYHVKAGRKTTKFRQVQKAWEHAAFVSATEQEKEVTITDTVTGAVATVI